MKAWYIEINGNRHEFLSWKETSRAWDIVKANASGDAKLYRDNGTLIDCA